MPSCVHICLLDLLILGVSLSNFFVISSKPQLHVLSLFPGGERSGLDIAAQMAANDINDATDILTDYEFILHINNTNPNDPKQDNKAMAERFLYHHIYEGPAIPILVGTYFSSESEILCESSALWDITQISYGAVSPRLSDRNRCPTFYRTIYSSVQQNLLRVKLLKHFGWDRVAIVAQNDLLFTAVSDNLRRLLEAENITVVASELFLNDASGTMRYIKEKDARIIIGLFYEPQARMALCEAYKQGIYGGRYAWIIRSIGFENPDFLYEQDPAITCTGPDLAKAAEGAITTTWKLTTDSTATMPTGKVLSNEMLIHYYR
ncbi:gamma-aminobutyric acid type B receptor subunit 1-like [Amphiura filiformis]|uniref:gamma-aminobutyric acid type B receptor subunit 1-like n=1 Tax=Amphiura filiformis TaxID=82378 RepID=UPI003B2279D1